MWKRLPCNIYKAGRWTKQRMNILRLLVLTKTCQNFFYVTHSYKGISHQSCFLSWKLFSLQLLFLLLKGSLKARHPMATALYTQTQYFKSQNQMPAGLNVRVTLFSALLQGICNLSTILKYIYSIWASNLRIAAKVFLHSSVRYWSIFLTSNIPPVQSETEVYICFKYSFSSVRNWSMYINPKYSSSSVRNSNVYLPQVFFQFSHKYI